MQTIARANRVFPGKHSGLIVDYANVFASLEKALAIYAKGQGGTTPVRDKRQLVDELRKAVEAVTGFCTAHGVDLASIEASAGLDRLGHVADAVDRLISPDPLRKEFLAHERWANTLYQAVKPDPAVSQFSARVGIVRVIADAIRERTGEGPADITPVMAAINALLDRSIAADGFFVREDSGEGGRTRPSTSPPLISRRSRSDSPRRRARTLNWSSFGRRFGSNSTRWSAPTPPARIS
jgi:type I restriction enzyme R subunit